MHGIDLPEGDYLFLEVGSTSVKFSSDELRSMFDPFTSGDVLKTDLRMSAVHGILKSHGGFMLFCQSEKSGGAIRLHFPCIHTIASEEKCSEPETPEKINEDDTLQ